MMQEHKAYSGEMQRIMILGCSGSGKSTLARVISAQLGNEVLHLDQCFWDPGWVKAPIEQFKKAHDDFIQKDKWIVDGNSRITMPNRLLRADTIIYLEFSTLACLWSVMKRRFQYWGKARPDAAEGCLEQIDWDLFKFIWNYNQKMDPIVKDMLSQQKDKKIIILKGRKEVHNFIENLKKNA